MKKTSCKLLAILCTAAIATTSVPFVNAADKASTNPKVIKTNIKGTTTHKKVGISIIKTKLYGKNARIKVRISNNTGKYLEYGNPYFIYRKEKNGKLINCDASEVMWTDEAYLTNDDKFTRTFSLRDFDLSEKGTYVLNFNFGITGKSKKHTAQVKFKAEGKK